MKTNFTIALLWICCLTACQSKDTLIFQDEHEICFDKFYVDAMYPGTESADSTLVSCFFFADNVLELPAELKVNLSGFKLMSDLEFGLRVVEEETTALPDEYTIDEKYIFHANTMSEDSLQYQDVIRVVMRRSERMKTLEKGVRLVVELVPNDRIQLGQVERIRAKIIATTVQTQPVWWTSEVENELLGVYSQKKYKLFLENVDRNAEFNGDLIKNSPDQAIKKALEFKKWLSEQEPAIREDDGSLMVVNV